MPDIVTADQNPGLVECVPDSARPLRVLFINDTSRNGGPGRTMLDILKFLDPARIHRTVLIPRDDVVSRRLVAAGAMETVFFERGLIENLFEPFSRPMERRDFDAPLPLKICRAIGNVLRGAVGLFRLVRRVRRERFDLVFCNGTSANFVGGVLAMVTGVPVLWHVFYPSVPAAIRGVHRRLAAQDNVRAIICVSRATSGQFAGLGAKVRVVHDALDIDEFDADAALPALRRELGLGPGTVVFGSHGRILPRKGYIELIQAAKIVGERLTAAQRAACRFVVLGDTPQDMRPDHLEECRELVRELGLDDLVQFIGFRPEVQAYLADFDVSIIPSIYEDPLPRAVLESMALSKPVIVFDVGGMAEMVTDGVEGRVLGGHPPDVEGLAEACLDYFSDPERWRRRGVAGRARVERDFEARKHSRALEDEMLRIVSSRGLQPK